MIDTSDDVLVLSVVAYGDDDLVVRLFGRASGRVGAFARAARRSKKRFIGGIHPFSVGQARLRARRDDALLALESSELVPVLLSSTVEPLTVGRAAYLCELVEKLVPERAPEPLLYDDLDAALRALDGGDARLLRAFELRLLGYTGYLPDLSGPVDGSARPVVAYDPVSGHLLADESARTVPFTDDAARVARALLASPLDALPAVDDDTLRVVSRLFAAHLRRQDVGPLKSVQFLKALPRPRT